MSLKILKPGVLDTIQDAGRLGYQHLGINPGGVMDLVAMQTANLLLGNEMNETVIEMFYPAPDILFEQNAFITITGANFSPMINGDGIKINRPVMVKRNTVIQFPQKKKGQCCYLAVCGGFRLEPWLHSFSTNLKAAAGGLDGRKLQRGDSIEFKIPFDNERLKNNDVVKLHWRAAPISDSSAPDEIFVLPGKEWNWLTDESKTNFSNINFQLDVSSDRMGYRLTGEPLLLSKADELVSSAVNFGTLQLLPNGQLVILMADSQTTGGYPRIGHVIKAHLSRLAQKQPGEKLKFKIVTQRVAEELQLSQYLHLQQLKNACTFKLQELLK